MYSDLYILAFYQFRIKLEHVGLKGEQRLQDQPYMSGFGVWIRICPLTKSLLLKNVTTLHFYVKLVIAHK